MSAAQIQGGVGGEGSEDDGDDKVLSEPGFLRLYFTTRNLNVKIPVLPFYESYEGGDF